MNINCDVINIFKMNLCFEEVGIDFNMEYKNKVKVKNIFIEVDNFFVLKGMK